MTTLAIVTHVAPIYPPTSGAPRRIWGLAKHLCSEEFDVSIVTTTDRLAEKVVEGVRIVETPAAVPLPATLRNKISQAMAAKRGEFAGPFVRSVGAFVTFYMNPYHVAVLCRMAAVGKLDLIQIEFPYVLPEVGFLKLIDVPVILDQHGVEIDFIREVASSRGTSVPSGDLLRIFLIESLAQQVASLILCCSDRDVSRMLSIYGGDERKYAVVENGVDDSFFEPVEPYQFGRPTVLYVGSFDHAPNRYAASWILHEIAPRVRSALPEVQFAFVGSALCTIPPHLDGALVFANIADIRPLIKGANVALSTVLHGSGTRLKTLEYLACGTPVVSTTKGVEGYDLKSGTDLLVANDKDAVADSIVELLRTPARAKEMAVHGQRTVHEKYTWSAIVSRSKSAYHRLLE
jgi:glycosyltransferase involved in cell wall biosynthesis